MQPSPKTSAQPERFIRLPELEKIVGLKKSSLYDAIKRGDFPQPVKLSRRAVCWPESAVQGWIQSRIRASQKA